jgi:hypothetical protein
MKNFYTSSIFICLLAFNYACTPTKVTQGTSYANDEDLTPYLKKYAAVSNPEKLKLNTSTVPQTPVVTNNVETKVSNTDLPNQNDNLKMDSLREQLYEFNRNVKSIQGYRILVYSGSDREEAQRIETDIRTNFQERADMSYDKPNFRIRVGSYIQRLEAYKTYMKLRKNYPNAIIVLDKIGIDSRRKR